LAGLRCSCFGVFWLVERGLDERVHRLGLDLRVECEPGCSRGSPRARLLNAGISDGSSIDLAGLLSGVSLQGAIRPYGVFTLQPKGTCGAQVGR
jgi:hypothetical protein